MLRKDAETKTKKVKQRWIEIFLNFIDIKNEEVATVTCMSMIGDGEKVYG